MTDPSDQPELAELLEAVLAQAEEIATLDGARAEAWASDLLALAAEHGTDGAARLTTALAAAATDAAATALAALGGIIDGAPSLTWRGPVPAWVPAIGTSRCEGAWALTIGGAVSVAFRFVDALDERHVITVDLLPGSPETVGEVIVGPGDLLDVLEEDDADIDAEDAGPAQLAARCVAALGATELPRMSAVANGRLLLHRLASLTEETSRAPVFVEDVVPEMPDRDPEDDAYARDVLQRALGPIPAAPSDVVGAVSAFVAPNDLAPFGPAERDALMALEWADWLGAVIGLVRSGVGTAVDGAAMVDFINRCPEVTTSIPKNDRARIEWAFDVVMESWTDLELLADGRLTDLGLRALPAGLHFAWS